jgi:hypothetical protein
VLAKKVDAAEELTPPTPQQQIPRDPLEAKQVDTAQEPILPTPKQQFPRPLFKAKLLITDWKT